MLRRLHNALRKLVALLRSLPHLHHIGRGTKLLLIGRSRFRAERGSKISGEGSIAFGSCNRGGNGASSMLTLDEGATIQVKGEFDFFYGADVQLFEGACLELGSGFINSGCKIRCHKSISIGNGCAISHDFTVMDSNAHVLDGSRGTAPVRIGEHVWIGTRVTVLPGVSVGNGAVIAAGSVVTRDVPACSLAAGVPARVIREDIAWEE